MPDLLLDTHPLVRWLVDPGKLSREQDRVLNAAARRAQPLAFSAFTLIEIAVIPPFRMRRSIQEILSTIEANKTLRMIPVDVDIAREIAALGDSLRDPGDRTIVATARVHGLRLVTSDQRIIDSKLVPVVE